MSFDRVVDYSDSSGVVDMYCGRWLWVSEFFEDNPYDLSFLCIEKRAPSSASAADAATSVRLVHTGQAYLAIGYR